MAGYQKDYYHALQVDPEAEPEVIQAAYRRLAQKHHPDAGGNDARMQELNEAYALLLDPDRRAAYDRWYAEHRRADPSSSSRPSSLPLWRALLPTILTLTILVVLVLDLLRLGIRGLPEITFVLVGIGWLIYHLSGLRSRWRDGGDQ